MKKGIHPKYYKNVKVRCVTCGTTFETGSTHEGEIIVEICSKCHPFYTGNDTVVDTSNLIAKFKNRQTKAQAAAKSFSARKKAMRLKKKTEASKKKTSELTLKDMLSSIAD
jgi:large subunit ribosomal protein L31